MIFDLEDSPGSDGGDVVVPELSDAVMRGLFSAAGNVLKLQPWKTLYDTDWFGIRDPDSGETHVAAVMGASRQFMAVQVYLPEDGIRFWNDFIRTGAPDHHRGMRHMHMVSCEFVPWNEEDMDETDVARNESHCDGSLVVDFLDTYLFRSTLPGCVNWHPEEREAVKLLDALRLLPAFLKKFAKLPPKCYEADHGQWLPNIPVFVLDGNGKRANPADWKMKVERFPQAAPEPDFLPDELFSARIAGLPPKRDEIWQIASNHVETPVVCDGRPRWMTITFTASLNSGMAFGSTLHPVAEPKENALRKAFLAAVKTAGFLPGTLCVRSEIAKRTFSDLPGVIVRQEAKLPLFDEIFGQLSSHLGRDPENHPLAGISPETNAAIKGILSRYPSPETMSPARIRAMMEELMEIEGAGILVERAAAMLAEGKKLPPPPAAPSKDRYVFRIELENLKQPIWRRLSIGAGASFGDLHEAIQALFGWEGGHCHCFQIRKGRRIESSIGPDSEYDDLAEHLTPLSHVFKRKGSKIHYVYDFGDDWTHLITQEGKVPAKKGEFGPICLGGERIAPPDDCGGPWGFESLLDPETDGENEGYDPEFLKHLREGKFSPEDVKF